MGGVVYADTEAAGQFNISQPLISCTVAGMIFGVVFSAVFIIIGKYICILAIELVPLKMDEALQFLKPVLLGAGLGALSWHFIKRRTIQFTFPARRAAIKNYEFRILIDRIGNNSDAGY